VSAFCSKRVALSERCCGNKRNNRVVAMDICFAIKWFCVSSTYKQLKASDHSSIKKSRTARRAGAKQYWINEKMK